MKSNSGKFKRSKNVILAILETLDFESLVNLGLESCSNLLKSEFKTSIIDKNDIFRPLKFAKIEFHVKSEWWEMIKFQSQALTSHFESFWSIVI